MKVTIPRSALKEAVAGFSKLINGKTHTLPILGCVRFEAHGSGLIAQATDLDQFATYHFRTAQVQGHGTCIVPLTALKDLAKGKDAEQIELETSANGRVLVTNHVGSQVVKHPLNSLDAADWPDGPPEVATQPANGFLETYRKLVPFSSTDSSRYVLQSVYVEVADKAGEQPVTMVATDGRRLTCWNRLSLPVAHSVIVPVSKFLAWPGLEGEVCLGLRTERVKKDVRVLGLALSVGPWCYYVKAIDGTYPNWRQAVPAPQDVNRNRITFTEEDVATLKKVLPSFPGHDLPHEPLGLAGAEGKLVISGRGPEDTADTTLELTGGSRFEGQTRIGVCRRYLLEALAAGFREFWYADALSPLRSEDGQGGIHVLMPLRLASERAQEEKAAEPEAAATTSADKPSNATNTPVASAPADEPQEEEENTMPEETTKGAKTSTTEQDTALDKLQAAYEVAKAKVREASQALAEVASAIKEAVRENRQLKADVENVRAGLAKLQQIKV